MDEINIYRKYIGSDYQVGKTIRSPFPSEIRKPDFHPSFSTKWFNGVICWNDFAIDVPGISKGPIGFVQLMEGGISREDAKDIIKNGGFSTFNSNRILTIEERFSMEKDPLIYTYNDLTPIHYQYYDMLFVSPRILFRYDTKALTSILKLEKPIWKASEHNFGFYYKIGSGDKSYMPFNKYYQPRTPKVMHQNIDKLEGYDQLPAFGKLLVITKSIKDVKTLVAAGYNAICCSSENSLNIFILYAYELSCRFDEIIVWGDPDKTGRDYGLRIKQIINKVKIANSIIAKDPSDIVMETRTQFFLHQILNRAA